MTKVRLNCIYNYTHRTKLEAYKKGFFLAWLIFDTLKDAAYASQEFISDSLRYLIVAFIVLPYLIKFIQLQVTIKNSTKGYKCAHYIQFLFNGSDQNLLIYEQRENHGIRGNKVFFTFTSYLPILILQTINNLVIGKTLNILMYLCPFFSLLSVLSVSH